MVEAGSPVIQARGLVKSWGATSVLTGLDFAVGHGVTGLLGSNGAGKTTLLGMILGLHGADSGELDVFGLDPSTAGPEVRGLLGYSPEHHTLPPDVRAHDLVRPLAGQQGKAALLGDLIAVLLAPYDDMGAFSGRVPDSVPRMGVGEATANTLALVLHELATNSLKRCPVVLHRHARGVVYGVGR